MKNSKTEVVFGITLFTLAAIFNSLFLLLIKISLFKFQISVAELVFIISCLVLPVFYFSAKLNKQDILNIPPAN